MCFPSSTRHVMQRPRLRSNVVGCVFVLSTGEYEIALDTVVFELFAGGDFVVSGELSDDVPLVSRSLSVRSIAADGISGTAAVVPLDVPALLGLTVGVVEAVLGADGGVLLAWC